MVRPPTHDPVARFWQKALGAVPDIAAIRAATESTATESAATHSAAGITATILATLRDTTIPAVTAAITALMAKLAHQTRSDTYTTTATGTAINLGTAMSLFSIQCKGTGGALSAWVVLLEGSLNGTDYSLITTHQTATLDGVVLPVVAPFPVLYVRSRATTITLGIGPTNIIATILAMP